MIQLPSRNFWLRTLFGSLFALLTAFFIFTSHLPLLSWLFVCGLTLLQAAAIREFLKLARLKGFAPASLMLIICSSFYILSRYAVIVSPGRGHFPTLILFLSTIACALSLLRHQKDAIANYSITFFGFIYVTFPLSLLLDINFRAHPMWLVWLLVTTKGGDMIAYLAGKTIGKHPLAPMLSPKKTIEGAICGCFGSAILSVLLASFWYTDTLSMKDWAWLGLIMGACAVLGDLSESLLKRDAQVKDSSAIPGLGGILDITDSLTFASPLLYFFLDVSYRLQPL